MSRRQFGNPGIERTQEFDYPLGRALPAGTDAEELA